MQPRSLIPRPGLWMFQVTNRGLCFQLTQANHFWPNVLIVIGKLWSEATCIRDKSAVKSVKGIKAVLWNANIGLVFARHHGSTGLRFATSLKQSEFSNVNHVDN